MTSHAPDANPLAVLQASLEQEREGLLTCVHCGFCLPACPTYRRLGDEADSPRGRLHLMRAVAEGRLETSSEAFAHHIDRCLGCRACEPVCPSGVPYGRLLEEARGVIRAVHRPDALQRGVLALFAWPRGLRLALWALRQLRRLRITGFLSRSSRLPQIVRRGLAMIAATAPVLFAPTHDPGTAKSKAQAGEPHAVATSAGRKPNAPLQVVHLDGCVQQGLFAHVNRASHAVLERNGCDLVTWSAGCCGALHAHAGDLDSARRLARRNISAFERSRADQIVVNAAGCGAALKDYGHWFEREPEWQARALRFSACVRDISETLAELGPATGAPLQLRVALDPPCHLLHAQGVDEAARRVLAAIPQLEVVDVPSGAECCGGAGLYGLTHPELADGITADKIDAIESTGCHHAATANPGCMMQIGAALLLRDSDVRVVHPIELLAESYRIQDQAP